MAGDAPAPRMPASVHTLDAARIAPAQRRTDDAGASRAPARHGANLHRDASARDGATQATLRAAKSTSQEDEPPTDGAIEPVWKVAEPAPPEPTTDSTSQE
jgi:hypothetical protein